MIEAPTAAELVADEAGPVITAAGPVPLLAGTFAIYDDQAGGYAVVAETVDAEGATQVHRKAIPAAMVRLVQGTGPMSGMFRKLAGG